MSQSQPLKISSLRPQMVNVTLRGVVKMKTVLLPFKNGKGKYFSFHLFESDTSDLRIISYNQCAETKYPFIINEHIVEITKITIKQNTYNNVTNLQGTLSPDSVVTECDLDIPLISIPITPIHHIPEMKEHAVNVHGTIAERVSNDLIMKDGSEKTVTQISLQDSTARITVTFWTHSETIQAIPDADLTSTTLRLENATISSFKGGVTLNVNLSTVVTLNPPDYEPSLSTSDVSFDVSQRLDDTRSTETDMNAPRIGDIIASVKRELEETNKQEEEIRIKKHRLLFELKHYESQL